MSESVSSKGIRLVSSISSDDPPMAPGKLSVLVVDDSLPIMKMTQFSLENAGHTVVCAKNGLVALNKMKDTYFDLVLMDVQMPVMDGIESVRLFRAYEQEHLLAPTYPAEGSNSSNDSHSSSSASRLSMRFSNNLAAARTRRQFIIGMSANGEALTRERALHSGMDAFLPKPFSLEGVMFVVENNITNNH